MISSVPPPNPTAGLKLSLRSFIGTRLTKAQVLSLIVLVVVLLIQFLRPSLVLVQQSDWWSQNSSDNIYPAPTCKNINIFEDSQPVSRSFKMTLLDEAKRVAAEFEYPAEEVNKGVKEFIKQMGSLKQ